LYTLTDNFCTLISCPPILAGSEADRPRERIHGYTDAPDVNRTQLPQLRLVSHALGTGAHTPGQWLCLDCAARHRCFSGQMSGLITGDCGFMTAAALQHPRRLSVTWRSILARWMSGRDRFDSRSGFSKAACETVP
jgi:hypothetical protein